jgi:hypothetical protein
MMIAMKRSLFDASLLHLGILALIGPCLGCQHSDGSCYEAIRTIDWRSDSLAIATRLDQEGEGAECKRAVSFAASHANSDPDKGEVYDHRDLVGALNKIEQDHQIDAFLGNDRQKSIEQSHKFEEHLQAVHDLTPEQRESYRSKCEGQGGSYQDLVGYCQMDEWGYDVISGVANR